MNRIRIWSWLVCLMWPLCYVQAQETHWQCDIYGYQYDMTVYPELKLDGEAIKASANYELAAFCGDECRGVAEVDTVPGTDATYYYLRVRSNVSEGETITFKYYSTVTKEEVSLNGALTFTSQAVQGYPSEPYILTGENVISMYTLTYTVDGVEYKKVEVEYGTVIIAEVEPTKEGHTFSGWNGMPETMPARDVTVTGSFTVNKYEVIFTIEGEPFKKDSVLYGTAIATPEVPVKEGHTFAGWGEVPETMPANDLALNGSYTVNSYTLLYIVDGIEYKKLEVEYGAVIIAEAEPTKEGHSFSGWNGIPESMLAQDVTVTGTFTVNKYEVVYTIEGEPFKKDSVLYGTAIATPEVPVKEGHTFAGWGEVPETMPANDLALNGNYTVNSYTLLYIVDGEEYKTVEVAYGETIEAEAEPTKEGYIFSGWSEIPDTMPANDVTVTGSFEVNSIEDITVSTLVDVYTLQGVKVKEQFPTNSLNEDLPRGIYIVNGKKMVVK